MKYNRLSLHPSCLWLELLAGAAAVILAAPVKAAPVTPAVMPPVVNGAIAQDNGNAPPQLGDATKDVDRLSPSAPPASPLAPSAPSAPIPSSPPPSLSPSDRPPVAPTSSTDIKILTPTVEAVLDTPATTVVLQFAIDSQVELRVNGELVNAKLLGRTETDAKQGLITQTWYGVALKDGGNTITASVKSARGQASVATVQVQVRGIPKKLTVATVESRIPADGRSTATITGQLLDEQGNRSNRDGMVTLNASGGEFVGADADRDQPGFQVKAQGGAFTATLRSSIDAKRVQIQATAGNLEAFTQLAFETSLRPSIATGSINIRLGARGTDFYGSFRDFLPPNKDNHTQLDVKSAVFATGRIGNWLFTGAYNSDHPLNQTCDGTSSLFRSNQSCDQNYPVYGDSSTSEVVAPSIDSVYARIERTSPVAGAGTDYFMWGDYNTEEFARRSQQFTATTRQLHGFKANYNFGNLQITGFYGNNVQGFQRDTIAPDGTSGYYFLSRRLLVPGSEDVFIELEELNRPGTVLDRKKLDRGPDYDVDYDRGTLLFRQPLLRTDISSDGQVLVRRLVVTYQYESKDSKANIYAGRLQYNLARGLNQESWLGATYLRENQGDRHFELYGADAYLSLGPNAHLIAEYAHSNNISAFSGEVNGSAYRLEAEGLLAKGILARAYWRSTDAGFANNATTSFVPGQTRYGANVTAQVSTTTALKLQYDHEDNVGIAPQPINTLQDLFNPGLEAVPGTRVNNSLTTITAGVQQKFGSADLQVDLLHRDRTDRMASNGSGLNSSSNQLRSRFTMPLTQNLTFFAQNETTLSSQNDVLNPDRTLVGLNWAVMQGVNVRLAQQFFTGDGLYAGQSITSLDVTGERKIGPDTTLTGRYSMLGGANGMTMQGAVGLNHIWKITPGLRLNLAYEHVFGNSFIKTGAGVQFAQPYAVGQSASALGLQGGDSYSVGLEYSTDPNFQASARYEHRSSSEGGNTVISASAAGKISPALTALFHYQQANASNQRLVGLGDTVNMKLGLAYRDPNDDRFNALLRYEYRKNPSTIPDTILLGSGTGSEDHTFALEALYAPTWRWEFYGKYAIRHSTSYLSSDLVGTSTVSLAQLRATYRFGYKWDVSGEVRWIRQPDAGYSETGLVAEVGYYLTPNLRLAAGYAFGRVSDRDFNGSRSADGPYLSVNIKVNGLFDDFGQQKIPPPMEAPAGKPVATQPELTTEPPLAQPVAR